MRHFQFFMGKKPKLTKAQKAINKIWKKVFLDTNQRLDLLLWEFNVDGRIEDANQFHQRICATKQIMSIQEVVQLIDKLVDDGYLSISLQMGINYYYISINGKSFIENGGYVAEVKKERLNKFWTKTKVGGVVLNGLILLSIAVWTFYSQVLKPDSKEKEKDLSISEFINLAPHNVRMTIQTNMKGQIPENRNSFQEAFVKQSALFIIEDSIKRNEEYFKILDLYTTAIRNKDTDKNTILNNRGALKFIFQDYYGAINDLASIPKEENLKLILGYCYLRTGQLDSAYRYMVSIIKDHNKLTEIPDTSMLRDTTKKDSISKLRLNLPSLEDNYKQNVSYALYYKGVIDIFQNRKAMGCTDLSKASSLDSLVGSHSLMTMKKLCQ